MFVTATEQDNPTGHITLSNVNRYTHILYDAESYSYDTMLRLLQQTPGNTLRLATYSTQTGNLITEDAIYSRD